MAHSTPRNAVAALTSSARAALQCVAYAEVLASASAPTLRGNLVVVSSGNVPPNTLLLQRPDRAPFLYLEIDTEYTIVQDLETPIRKRYQALVTMYLYAIKDLDGRELLAYHWHPAGLSTVHTPHMHVSSARPIALPTRSGSAQATELFLNRVHFPTHHIELAELVRFLITELGVGPRRSDWETVLSPR